MLTTLPNLLTLSRIAAIPLVIVTFYVPAPYGPWAGCVLFAIAGITHQQHANGAHLKAGLPLGEAGGRHSHLELGKVLTQTRDEDLARQDDQRREQGRVGNAMERRQHEENRGD